MGSTATEFFFTDSKKDFGLNVGQIRELAHLTFDWPDDSPVRVVTETTTIGGHTSKIRTGFRAEVVKSRLAEARQE